MKTEYVELDEPLWQMYQDKLLSQNEAIRLQELSNQMKSGKPPPPLDRKTKDLIDRFSLYAVQPESQARH
jgi:hypothetical protein